MNKHTPGDWFVTLDGATVSMRAILSGPLIRIASIDRRRNAYSANARLIAAAPDLLAALERAEEILLGGDPVETSEPWCQELVTGVLRPAIAKARGE